MSEQTRTVAWEVDERPGTGVPAVSVCVPVYQGAAFIGRAVESVLAQSLTDFELVIRDNGSTDGTSAVVRSFADPRIRLVRQDDTVPLPENWNRTVALVRAPLVKILCADDVLTEGALERQVAAMNADPGLSLTSGRVDMLDEEGRTLVGNRGLRGLLGTRDSNAVVRRIVRHGGNPVGQPVAVMFRRSAFDEVGGFDGDRIFLMDLDLWARLLGRGRLHGIGDTVAGYRISTATVSGKAGRREFRAQREFTASLAREHGWHVRRRDALVGAAGAYAALGRRHALVVATRLRSGIAARRTGRFAPAR